MAWYSIEMPEESITDGGYHRFCRQFQKAFIGAGAPPDLALFARRNGTSTGRRLYLTPCSSGYVPELVNDYGAEPCDVPEEDTVTLVYGVPGAKTLLTVKDEMRLLHEQGDGASVTASFPAASEPHRRPIYAFPRAGSATSS